MCLLGPALAHAQTIDLGASGWQVQSSALAPQGGHLISEPGFSTTSWLHVANDDGGAPGTEIEALVQNGACPDVYYSTNLKTCFGSMSKIGKETVPEFAVPWWYRTTFPAQTGDGRHASLIVNGVVGDADLYVDGHEVASNRTIQGAFTRFTFDVSSHLQNGTNAVALRVHPNNPWTMFTLDNVDWTQIPPDNNTGIQFPVQLHTSGAISLTDSHVVQQDSADLSQSALTVKATVSNGSASPQSARVSARISAPGGHRPIHVSTTVTLAPDSSQQVTLTPAQFPALTIDHPQVWWPYQMGRQPLYGLTVKASSGGRADTEHQTFGIRTVTTRLIGRGPLTPDGSRQFLVNGVPFVFRGGGWSEDLLLHYSAQDTANQIQLIKNLGLNGIRTEGHQMPADFYEQMDRAGILIDAGYQCCDAWQLQNSGRTSNQDYHLLRLSALTIGQNLRNHPSVLDFAWSDDAPTPRQAKTSLQGFQQADFQDPLISSAEYKTSPQLGPSGEKEGPYDWVPPSYWYDTSHYNPGDPTRTNVGGAWGFDSEASSGDTVPTLDSIQRFLSPFEQTELWQDPDYNQYHLNYEQGMPGPDNGGYAFGTLHDLDQAIAARYGQWNSLEQYVAEAQLQNYETQRAQFEAYIAHSQAAVSPSTGIVYWQLNKGWPTLLWDLYNNDYDQAGSYFGAQEANRPFHAFYAYDSGGIGIDNLSGHTTGHLVVHAQVRSLGGTVLWSGRSKPISLTTQGVAGNVLKPVLPAQTSPPTPAQTYFVQLVLTRHGTVVDRNTYWLSTQPDEVNWPKTIGWPQATMSQYADLTGLQQLPQTPVTVTAHTRPGTDVQGDQVTSVTITNPASNPSVAFFVRADVRRGSADGTPAAGDNEVLPAFWSSNDTTLWPGQSETLRVRYAPSQLQGSTPVISVGGWNTPSVDVPAG